jgi:hypothetical protein
VTFPTIDRLATARPLWDTMKTADPAEHCTPSGVSRGMRYGLYFYAGRELPECSASRERTGKSPDGSADQPAD